MTSTFSGLTFVSDDPFCSEENENKVEEKE
jgi:hypothetical protein